MQAIILLGGKGTRLHALHPDKPKALVPIAGRPFLERQIEWLARGGVTDVHLAAGHLADVLQAWVARKGGDGFRISDFRFRVSLSAEPFPLGTAGGLKFVEPHIRSNPFLVVNGDSLMPNLDFQSLEKTHRGFSNAWTTIAVAPIEESGRYGTVEFDEQGHITAFREKAERKAGWVNGGVYLMAGRALSLIDPGRHLSIETDLFPRMAARRQLRAFQGPPPLLDMGTPEGIQAMEAWIAAKGA